MMKTRNTKSLSAALAGNQTDREIVDGNFIVTSDAGVLAVESTEEAANAKASEIEFEFGYDVMVCLVIDEA